MDPELHANDAGQVDDAALSTSAELRAITTTTGIHRLGFIDGLRGLAAVYVVISHCWDSVFTQRPPSVHRLREFTSVLGFGRYAVAVFIVVSGFSIGLGAWKGGLNWPGGAWMYIKRRVTRIWPPYLVAVLLCSLVAATVLSGNDGSLMDAANHIRPWGVVTSAFFFQDITWQGPAGSTAFWSIPVEFDIYFAFLVLLIFMRRWRWSWLCAVLGLMLLTAVVTSNPSSSVLTWIGGLFPSLYVLFILGFIASGSAVAHVRFNERRWWWMLLGLLALALSIIAVCHRHETALGPLNDLVLGPIIAFVLTQLVLGRWAPLERVLSSRLCMWLGDCSYSVYLIHSIIIDAVWRFAVRPTTHSAALRLVLEICLGVPASVVVGRVFFLLVERPFLRRRASVRARTTATPPAPESIAGLT